MRPLAGVDHPLGAAGGTRGVEDGAELVAQEARPSWLKGWGPCQVVKMDGRGQCRRPVGYDDLAQVREAVSGGEVALLLGIDDDCPRLTIVEDEARLLRLIAQVDRYRNKASLPAGKVGDQHLRTVAHPEGDAVTRLQLGAQQVGGEAA